VPFWWEVPKVERAAARVFTLRIAVPEAVRGEGLRVAVGPPEYDWGELRIGPRGQWGDLVFATRATQVHVLDTLRTLRRQLPWPLRTDGALVLGLLLMNLAAAVVIRYLVSIPAQGTALVPDDEPPGPHPQRETPQNAAQAFLPRSTSASR
jgi:hypothetical protein